MEKKYLISVDGGGTKTEFCVLELVREDKKVFSFGSSNYKTAGIKSAQDNIIQSFHLICETMKIKSNELAGIVLGLSGCDTEEDRLLYENILERTGIGREKIFLCNDSELLLLSAAQPPGIGIIAGTGSIAVGIDRKYRRARCGGWGSPLSDMGSGYYISAEVLKEWIRYCDEQAEHQPVFEKLYEFYGMKKGISIQDKITTFSISQIASCARIISEEADMQDGYCRNIVEEAAYYTAELAYGIYKKLKLEKEETINVVVAGSIFKSECYMKSFKSNADRIMKEPNINYIVPEESPADAGLILAKNLFM